MNFDLPSLLAAPRPLQAVSLGRAFWLQWVVASAIALPIGSSIGGLVGEGGGGIRETLGFAIVGALVGTAQWAVLRRHAHKVNWYVLATVAGYSVVGLLAATMGWVVGGETGWGLVGAKGVAVRFAVGGTVAGIVVGAWLGFVNGLSQWLSLRHHVSPWFVGASMLSEAAGGAASFTLGLMVGTTRGDVLRAAEVFVGGGALAGALTGLALVFLFAHAARRDLNPDRIRRQ
ncbi:MAG: hypothetical protein HY685_03745 [Chloroflexi bacterium]|nr:hypothetical protein [Chloroflexota bacterium]